MNIRTATRDDERWLRRQAKLVPDDLKAKYAAMRADLFEFLRATHYRWSVTIASVRHIVTTPAPTNVGHRSVVSLARREARPICLDNAIHNYSLPHDLHMHHHR